jgi:hypothetical protein
MVASDVAVTGVTVASASIGTVDHGAGLNSMQIGRSAAIETVRSGSTVETRGTRWPTSDVARRSAWSTTNRRTTGAQTRRRPTSAETRRGTGEGWRRTRRRAELRKCGTWRDECDAEY